MAGERQKKKNRGKEKIPDPQPTLLYILSMPPSLWNISVGQLGLSAWLCPLPAPAHLLIS